MTDIFYRVIAIVSESFAKCNSPESSSGLLHFAIIIISSCCLKEQMEKSEDMQFLFCCYLL